ncbi:MAG: methyltransferase domain-containing protein [Pseudomonadota bacterium]
MSFKKVFRAISELLLLPLQIFLPEPLLKRFRLKNLKDIRHEIVLQNCRGRLLDIGCGKNELINKYGNGIGVDIKQWGAVDYVCDPSSLPFEDKSFDTIVFVASINHIINRKAVLFEAKRCLNDRGQILITMINPFIGWCCHKIEWINWDLEGKGLKKGELPGMSKEMIENLLQETGFCLKRYQKFLCGLNNLYVAEKYDK